ncbi:hypothetical protein SEEM842_07411 [Salmonella enterica subsp. enterica serovar Senftenberg str. 423984-2]|nr:hypothetical protein SEES004_09402 [Salmonella enterica subsp. enterica serovar Senftenberg str. 361154004]ESC19841.1 hypothetical protein SEEM841_01147 [Salmonella enterica subsp. enterica serovar Senftenberg str. 423984-1]ESG30644.1 hypothetical protein SEEM842_07411 [Salmonella enterica subsp. enterica serovar Senftenberg str. 423984-2]ESG61818.1 hypothetical protein SEEM162_03578 [Salmonella enterica subsp. enterica serovar Senftenberg str. 316235162]
MTEQKKHAKEIFVSALLMPEKIIINKEINHQLIILFKISKTTFIRFRMSIYIEN